MYGKVWETQVNRLKSDLQRLRPPTRLRLRLTLRCNLKCEFCIQRTFSPKDIKPEEELTKDELLKIISDAADLGVKFVEISGNGEPLCKEGLLDIMTAIKQRGMFGELTTNGTLFDLTSIKKVVDIKWDLIRFSIDSAKAETHDLLRGLTGAFENAKNSMNTFKKVKNENHSEKPQIAINFIITNKNFEEIPDIISMLNEVKGEKIWFTPMILQNKKSENLILRDEEKNQFDNIIKKAEKMSKKYSIETNLQQFSGTNYNLIKDGREKNNPFCFMPWSDIVIGEYGQIGPCFAFYFYKANVKNKSLIHLWEGSEFSKIRKELLKGQIPKVCNECKQWWGPEEAKQIHRLIKNARGKD